MRHVSLRISMMNTLSFEFLDKSRFAEFAPRLFDILHGNMSVIAPSGNSRESDEKTWFDAVSGGLASDRRQIVLIRAAEKNVGFFQYYINPRTFMMEEVQLLEEYQGRGVRQGSPAGAVAGEKFRHECKIAAMPCARP